VRISRQLFRIDNTALATHQIAKIRVINHRWNANPWRTTINLPMNDR